MKKTLLLSFSLLLVLVLYAKNDIEGTRRAMGNTQMELRELRNRKNVLTTRNEQLNANLQEAQRKVEVLQDKPNSPAYKSAIKKVETITEKINKNEIEIQKIDSTSKELLGQIVSYQQETVNDVSQEPEKIEVEQEKADTIAACNENKEAKLHPQINIENQSYNEENESYILQKDTPTNEKKTMSDEEWNALPWYKKALSLFLGGGWIILCFIVAIFRGIASLRCPKCGKWFTMEFVGGANTWSEKHDRVFRKKYECSNCGYTRTTISPIPKKNK